MITHLKIIGYLFSLWVNSHKKYTIIKIGNVPVQRVSMKIPSLEILGVKL